MKGKNRDRPSTNTIVRSNANTGTLTNLVQQRPEREQGFYRYEVDHEI